MVVPCRLWSCVWRSGRPGRSGRIGAYDPRPESDSFDRRTIQRRVLVDSSTSRQHRGPSLEPRVLREFKSLHTRCGWTLCRCHTRCTIVRETPRCLASVRVLQCVLPSPGLVFKVASRIFCSNSAVSTLPRRFRLMIPVMAPIAPDANAARVLNTVGRASSTRLAMATLDSPWCARRITRHRVATRCEASSKADFLFCV